MQISEKTIQGNNILGAANNCFPQRISVGSRNEPFELSPGSRGAMMIRSWIFDFEGALHFWSLNFTSCSIATSCPEWARVVANGYMLLPWLGAPWAGTKRTFAEDTTWKCKNAENAANKSGDTMASRKMAVSTLWETGVEQKCILLHPDGLIRELTW